MLQQHYFQIKADIPVSLNPKCKRSKAVRNTVTSSKRKNPAQTADESLAIHIYHLKHSIMANENNQPTETQQSAPSFDKDGLKNYVFLTETLEKLGIGKTFDKLLREGMLAGAPLIEKPAIFTLDDKDQKVRVTPRIDKTEGENGGPFYVLRGFRAALLNKEGKESVSHFFKVFKKTGFTLGESRNMLEGRSVLNRAYPDRGEPYDRYSRINFEAKDDEGNFLQQNKSARTLDFDMSKGLSAIPGMRSLTQREIEDVGRMLAKGYDYSFLKRGAGNSVEKMTLYAQPFESTLTTVDGNGEPKVYPANKINMRAVGVLEPDISQQNTQPDKNQADLGKGAKPQKKWKKARKTITAGVRQTVPPDKCKHLPGIRCILSPYPAGKFLLSGFFYLGSYET